MDSKRYQHLTTKEFLEDEYFRSWVLNTNSENDTFWRAIQNTFPEQVSTISAAKKLLLSVNGYFEKEVLEVSEKQAKASFQKVAKQIPSSTKVVKMTRGTWMAWTAAACVTFLVGIATFLYFQTEDTRLTFATGNGQRMPMELPDGSQVQLNANSTLYYYPKNWWDKKERQVWLDGEAFFKVEKKAFGTKFIVHAGDMQVAVLGTQFNVRARGEKAEVVLEEGKVELAIEAQIITMQPGDLVSYSKRNRKVASKKVKTADYVAWKDGITIFNNELSEVAKELEILYGVKFTIKNKDLEERMIQLSAPTNSLEQVLETLELLYPKEISIERKDGEVLLF